MDDTFTLFPMFSTPIGVIKISKDIFDTESLLEKCIFNETQDYSNGSYSTLAGGSDFISILDYFPEEKKLLMSYFNIFKNEALRLTTTDFKITTSWVTKTIPGGYSQLHNHKNSVYSAVFYFDDVPGGKISFESINIHNDSMLLNDPDEWTPYLGKAWVYPPEKNNMLIFPSSVFHSVTRNDSEQDRYSLVINLFPTGKIGQNDSYIDIATT